LKGRLESKLLVSILVILLGFSDVVMVVKGETLGWQVDVYTQKETFNGVGLGVSSDAFAPLETVVLFAYVTYNLAPVQNILVAYRVYGPPNTLQNISFALVAQTNNVGVAKVDFTIPWPNENAEAITFGNWTVLASIENASDFLCFRVGWLVEIASLRVEDVDPPQGGWLNVEVSLENICMTSKNVSLSFVLFDSLNQVIGSLVSNVIVNVGFTNFSCTFQIPYWATVGWGRVHGSVYASNGVPYCPGVSEAFFISLLGDLNGDNKVDVRDVSIVALAFGSYPGHARWNPVADVNKDRKIDVRDVALVAKNFGKVYS